MSSNEQLAPQIETRPRVSPIKRLVRVVLLSLAPIVAILVGGYLYATGGRIVSTENAYVKADKVAISTDIDGRVIEVTATDNQVVKAGDLLFRLDPEPYRIALDQAEAKLRTVAAEIEATRALHRQKVQALNRTEIDIGYMRREFERQRQLIQKGHASKAKYDEAEHNLELARQASNAMREQISEVVANLGGDPDIPVEQHPDYLAARSVRDEAALALKRTEVYAPIDGVVTRMTIQPGEWFEEGEPIFSIVDTGRHWIEANLKETELTYVHEGLKARVKVDAYPGLVWEATVDSISPATGAEFSLLPPQNATGNWVKVVQRIPVHLALGVRDNLPPLRAGMSVQVEIDTERDREVPGLVSSALGLMKDED